MKERKLSVLVLFIVCLTLFSGTSYGDVYMEQKTHIDEITIMGQRQPAQDFIVKTWITPDRVSVEDENTKTILDLDKGTMTIASHRERTLTTLPLNFSEITDEKGESLSEEEKEDLKNIMGEMMKVSVNVLKTNEKKKIGKWNCRKYIQTMSSAMGTFESIIWATEDLKIDEDLYAKYLSSMKGTMPGMNENIKEVLRETKKIKGVQVYTEHTNEIMGQTMRSNTELIEYKEGDAPADAFEMPAGYESIVF